MPGKIYVKYLPFKDTFHGGMRGKTEYRRHVHVKSLVGNTGRNDIFRGACADCGAGTYIGMRKEKSKSLHKCSECGFTSFLYKGFFRWENWDPDARDDLAPSQRYPVEPPKPEEYEVPLFRGDFSYSDMDPKSCYGPVEYILDKAEGDFYNDHEGLWRVTEGGYEEKTVDELRRFAEEVTA